MSRPLRVAMLAHSTLPRGGVVHAMNLSEALTALGVETVLHAPDVAGVGFPRAAACATRPFRVAPAPRDMTQMVEQRIADYVSWFRREENRGFDLYHAHDGISGNALARLKQEGLIDGFIRTVHHVDDFSDPRLNVLQARSIREADALIAVSDLTRRRLRGEFGRDAEVCGNGVDMKRFAPAMGCDRRPAAPSPLVGEGEGGGSFLHKAQQSIVATPLPGPPPQGGRESCGAGAFHQPSGAAVALRACWGLGDGPVFLAVGGVEARKNTLRILQAFDALAPDLPEARLLIAGGASLLDHGAYQSQFRALLDAMDSRARVVLAGLIADVEMPALYRLAAALVFASVKEGFGLCVLEAMACGTPVIVSRIAPFTEYVGEDDARFCDPYQPASIAEAMRAALRDPDASRLRARGLALAAKHSWRAVAEKNLSLYHRVQEPAYA